MIVITGFFGSSRTTRFSALLLCSYLRFLQQMRAHAEMLQFEIGDRVSFQPTGRQVLSGILIRYNRKTVTILTEGGEQWNVSPSLLRQVEDVSPARPEATRLKVVNLCHK